MPEPKRWVVGFLFKGGTDVALVAKTHPAWQAGKLNGVGGKVEDGETPLQAMQREFLEEAGAQVDEWREFALLNVEPGVIHFFCAHGNHDIRSLTEEQVSWHALSNLNALPVIPNLHWLIPLALDEKTRHAIVDEV